MKIRQSDEQKVYYTSDTHYGHANMVRALSKWGDKENSTRDFKTIAEMNEALIAGINGTVMQDDVLFHLGDWSMGNTKNIKEFRDRIICRNVHLVFGNHDDDIEDDNVLLPGPSLHGLFSSVQSYKEAVVDGTMLCMFHYKQTIWNKSHRDAYHLYGHSHSGAEHLVNGRSMDVGVDNAFKLLGSYRPFSHAEMLDHLKYRRHQAIDHHGAGRD